MINKDRPQPSWDDRSYRAGYLAGEEERVALAMENDRLRHELHILENMYRALIHD